VNKIPGKFYPLQLDEWLEMCKILKPAEKDVLYFIRASDPYNTGLEISVTNLATSIGRDKGTVSRALKALDKLQLIDLELVKVKVKVLAKGLLSTDNFSCVHTTQVAATQPELCTDNLNGRHTTEMATTQHLKPETVTQQDFQEPKINKTNKIKQDLIRKEEDSAKIQIFEVEILEETTETNPLNCYEANKSNESTSPVQEELFEETNNFSLSPFSAGLLNRNLALNTTEVEMLKNIEKLSYNYENMPWRESLTKFRPDIEALVYKANPDWYSLPGGAPNLKKVRDRLKKLESSLRSLNTSAIDAYQELMNYCQMAEMESNGLNGKQVIQNSESEAFMKRMNDALELPVFGSEAYKKLHNL
jgi:hypothetical protein